MEEQMSVAAVARKNDGGDDLRDPRDVLKEKISDVAAVQAELSQYQQAASKARELVRKSATTLEAAAAAVTEANEEDATALADAIISGDSSSSAGAVRRARTAEIERRDEAAAAKAAYDRLRIDVSGIAAEVERAERGVQTAIGGVLQPTARRLLDEARNLRLEFLKRVYAVDTMRALLPPDFDEEKQKLLTFIAPELMAASAVTQQRWKAAIEQLRSDSEAPLSEV
jgi:hypothetical protein